MLIEMESNIGANKLKQSSNAYEDEVWQRLIAARHHNPHSLLGLSEFNDDVVLHVYRPDLSELSLRTSAECTELVPMSQTGASGLFVWRGKRSDLSAPPTLVFTDPQGISHEYIDPYSFAPVLDQQELQRFNSQAHWHAYRIFGSHSCSVDGVLGVRFAVWAPNAERVSVVGDFNRWDGRIHMMTSRGGTGVWEIFIPGMELGCLYKYEIRNRDTGDLHLKSDPYANHFEMRPNTASLVAYDVEHSWGDHEWMQRRDEQEWLHAPLSIYEIHLGSWRRTEQGGFLNYRVLADQLIPYVCEQGFNAIQLMPITEHPLDDSWGYQVTGFFAPSSRFGSPDDLRYFVDCCHQNNIRVLLDWVPAHFPKDAHGLARFDGSAVYEHEDPLKGEHRDWGTLIFNYGRTEVRNFLLSSAFYWFDEFHIDGLRVDAVASMLYLDYSRNGDEWIPNEFGGNENLEAVSFLRELNTILHKEHPGCLIMAEESTSWPMVSRPVYLGGLGFSMKWNMGWMNDSLDYFSKESIYRKYHHDQLTFGLLYAFTENFILPLSHDEVVHGKRSLLNKMPGDEWQRFANLRLLFIYLYTQPGKKLLFMGGEFAQSDEWNHNKALDWSLLERDFNQGVQLLVRDLNFLYISEPALHYFDFSDAGFHWIDCHDSTQSVISYLRKSEQDEFVVVLNFTPEVREGYRIGVPESGVYEEVINTDSSYYRGSNVSNGSHILTENVKTMGFSQSIRLTLPPLAGLILRRCSSN
jgi:1,4-alpha-glucan branching enzyme